jgi:UDP-N-acetylmuramate dehydrogenase
MNLREHVTLGPYTTLGIGGPARWFAEACTEQDVAEAAAFAREANVPIFVLGGGSNLLVSDEGYPGLVLRIALPGIEEEQQGIRRLFRVGAGVVWDELVAHAVSRQCAGIECLAGIPGTTGGTPVQNVGAYGQEVAETISCIRGFDLDSARFVEWTGEECGFAYRSSRFNTRDRGRHVLTRVDFSLLQGGPPSLQYADLQRYFAERGVTPSLQDTSRAVRTIRKSKGMVISSADPDSRSVGSFFKNPVVPARVYEQIAAGFAPAPVPHYPAPSPEGDQAQVKIPAAWLLEKAGFHRGYVRGQAGISSRHALALINRGQARAADILALRDEIMGEVERQFGVTLVPEPVWLGQESTSTSHDTR